MKDKERIESFFVQAEPAEKSGRYIIGAFESGITLYKQQVRALNLLYALHETERLKRGAKIAIIGGGVSGVTAAAAALTLGYEVYLFERRPILGHLQHGCDTRWIHPHIYDWPTDGSESIYAGLPLLSWRAGTASEVIEQILQGFQEIVEKNQDRIHIHQAAIVSFPFSNLRRLKWTNSLGSPRNKEKIFDAIIFAVGFGVEHATENDGTPSYWRNDSINQPEPGASVTNKTRFLVSGMGDGGLIDLLRVCLVSYYQGRILRETITSDQGELIVELRRIAEEWKEKGPFDENSTWLYDQYDQLDDRHLLEPLHDRLHRRLRQDTSALLNGKARTFSQALRLDHASLFHTLLVYSLHTLGAFTYKRGNCTRTSTPPFQTLLNGRKIEVDRVILRHGTNREAVLREAGCTEGVSVLTQPDSPHRRIDTSVRLWPAGWWGLHAERVLSSERTEFVPPATMTIGTTFISTLSDIIQLSHRNAEHTEFRMVLHRLINIEGEDFFQQIARYAGTRTAGEVGRVFSIKAGLVGIACRLGKPVIIHKDNQFNDVLAKLNFPELKARPIDPSVQSLLACPFFASTPEDGHRHVTAVLFMDSSKEGFFTQPMLEIIYGACRGFVKNLEIMHKKGEIFFASSSYQGYEVQPLPDDETLVHHFKGIETDNKVFEDFVEDLTFETIRSFDMDSRLINNVGPSNSPK